MSRFAFLLLIFGFSAANAHQAADGDIHASLGAMTYMGHAIHTGYREPIFMGPGLTAEADIDRRGGLEIGMFYLQNPFAVEQDGHLLVQQLKRMYVSTGYRHWFKPEFSLALGFSSSYAMGEGRVLRNDFPGDSHPQTSAQDVTEYGVDLSVQYEPFRRGRYALVVDGRYGLSLTPKPGEDSNHFGAFLALKYFVQSRSKIDTNSQGAPP